MERVRNVKVSVIMSVYNPAGRRKLFQAVDSVINQTFQDWEMILYDDGSGLAKSRVIRKAAERDMRIRYMRCGINKGTGYALNACLKAAKGEFVARMDGDDISRPDRLEKQYHFLVNNPQYAFVGSNALFFDENGVWGLERKPEVPGVRDFRKNSPYVHPSVMFRKKVLEENGGYCTGKDTRRCEDYELFMRLHSLGQRGYNLQKPLFYYREDLRGMKRRRYRYRIDEMKVRCRGFQSLGIRGPGSIPYILKPLAAGLPFPLIRRIRRSQKRKALPVDTVAYVLVPALNAYVLWILREAVRLGKERIYFLSRDGWLMYRAAQIYCRRFRLPVECRYLYCSRHALRVPLFQYDFEEALTYICRGGIGVTMGKIMRRGGLTGEEGKKILGEIREAVRRETGRDYGEKDEIFHSDLGKIQMILSESRGFRQLVERYSGEAKPYMCAYLRQEGFFDEVEMAVADSGWVGSMQKSLNLVRRLEGVEKPLAGFYFGLYELPEGVKREDYHCYYFSPEKGLKERVWFSNCLFEGIFSAPHGMTKSYQMVAKENGYPGERMRAEPVFEEADAERVRFCQNMERQVVKFAKEFTPVNLEKMKQITTRRLARFMGHPTRPEAERFGVIPFSDDVLEDGKSGIAAALDERELRANHVWNKVLVMVGIRKEKVKESAWYEGSAVRYGKKVQYHLVQYRIYKYLLYMRKMFVWRWRNGK